MKLKKWIIGAVASLVLSGFVAGSGLAADMTWKAFLAVFCAACLTHFGAWMKQNPPEQITFDTDTITKPKDE